MHKFGAIATRIIGFLEGLIHNITGVFLGIIILLMAFEVVARYLLKSPFMYAEPFIMMMMAFNVFLLIGPVARPNEHIRIGFFSARIFGRHANAIMFGAESLVSLGLTGYFVYWGIRWVELGRKLGVTETITPNGDTYPAWIPHLIVPIGLSMAGLFYIERVVRQIQILTGHSKGQGKDELPTGETADLEAL